MAEPLHLFWLPSVTVQGVTDSLGHIKFINQAVRAYALGVPNPEFRPPRSIYGSYPLALNRLTLTTDEDSL